MVNSFHSTENTELKKTALVMLNCVRRGKQILYLFLVKYLWSKPTIQNITVTLNKPNYSAVYCLLFTDFIRNKHLAEFYKFYIWGLIVSIVSFFEFSSISFASVRKLAEFIANRNI